MSRLARGVLAGLFALVWGGSTSAGILIEGRLEGVPIRLEFAHPGEPGWGLVRASVAGEVRLLDVARPAGEGTVPPRSAGGATFRLDPLGGGAMVAGFGGAWQILMEGERVCGEVLAAGWMVALLEPAIRAIELLERGEPRLRPRARHGCSPIGFREWTRRGWPLLAGGRTDAVFLTERIRFDHPLPPSGGP